MNEWQEYIEEQLVTLNQLETELQALDFEKDKKRVMPLMRGVGEIIGELMHMGVPRELIDKARQQAAASDGEGSE